jgi:glycerophosphoryl diester phosphodiesterase
VPVLLHDDTLDRTTNMIGPLRARLWAELAECRCKDENGGPAEPMATLEQVINWAKDHHIKMIFDVKDTDKEVFLIFQYLILNSKSICLVD